MDMKEMKVVRGPYCAAVQHRVCLEEEKKITESLSLDRSRLNLIHTASNAQTQVQICYALCNEL
jgi:hypothetical protein